MIGNDPNAVVIFDLAAQSYYGWRDALIPLLAIPIGIAVSWLSNAKFGRVVGFSIVGLGLIMSPVILATSWLEYSRLKSWYESGRYELVEGRVQDFRPDDQHGKTPQTFEVEGHRFTIWWRSGTFAYHETVGSGGVILDGRCVKIAYTERGEIIWLAELRSAC